MSIDYSGFKFHKGTPRAVSKLERQREAAKEERDCRAAVDARDQHRCFFPRCRTKATEKHHILSRSVRGQTIWRTDDILSACQEHHRWFKAALITVSGNPDKGPVQVALTSLGEAANIRIPERRKV